MAGNHGRCDEAAIPRACLHLWSALLAVLSLGLICAGIEGYARMRLHGAMDLFARSMAPVKLTGNVLQTTAFRLPGFLPIYGSSELDHFAENRPDTFFVRRPTGFEAFPIGKAGNTCLVILEKLAAAGGSVRGKKVAVILSPSWFLRDASAEAVASNLRPLQVGKWVFESRLSAGLRRDIARRLITYPRVLAGQNLLQASLTELAEGKPEGKISVKALAPLGWFQNVLLERLEYWALLRDLPGGLRSHRQNVLEGQRFELLPPNGPPDWAKLACEAEAYDRSRGDRSPFSVGAPNGAEPRANRTEETEAGEAENEQAPVPSPERDADFQRKLGRSGEWVDLALLLRVLRELGADALIISQPFNGVYRDLGGNSAQSRRAYYTRLGKVVRAAGYPVLDFSEHEEDRTFFNDAGHPSAKAWIFYDHALDDFYHGRLAARNGSQP